MVAKLPQSGTFNFALGPYASFQLVPRSPYGLFTFLGNLLKVQRANLKPDSTAYIPPRNDALPPETEVPPSLLTTTDRRLMTIVQVVAEKCFTQTRFYDGDYCVPESATNTKSIFVLLAQIIGLKVDPQVTLCQQFPNNPTCR